MKRCVLPILIIFGTTTGTAEVLPDVIEQVELRVVGVYRPLELDGRFVRVPREVFLQSGATAEAMKRLVGKTITVHRTVNVPASVDMESKADRARRLAEARKRAKRKRNRRRRRRRRALEPAKMPLQDEGNRTAAFAPPRARQKVNVDSGGSKTQTSAEVVRPTFKGVSVEAIEITVGQVEVMTVRGDVAVARVVSDGVGDEQTITVPVFGGHGLAELPAIMSGDLARYEVKRPPKEAAPLQGEDLNELDEDMELLEREELRRQQRQRRFQRDRNRWNL